MIARVYFSAGSVSGMVLGLTEINVFQFIDMLKLILFL